MIDRADRRFMDAALAHARAGLGRTAPNPTVGCILVKDGRVIGAARTADGGRPHAETQALAQAGEQAHGATAYVSLEPCAHTGLTGPCADALIEAGIARCVIALTDPDPRVDGGGIARLKAAGVEVVTGVREAEAGQVNAGFLSRLKTGLPFVVIDTEANLYDGTLTDAPDGIEAALRKLADQGVLRVRIAPDSPLVEAALQGGFAVRITTGNQNAVLTAQD